MKNLKRVVSLFDKYEGGVECDNLDCEINSFLNKNLPEWEEHYLNENEYIIDIKYVNIPETFLKEDDDYYIDGYVYAYIHIGETK